MSKEQFSYSFDEEHYSGQFDSRDEALAEAKSEAKGDSEKSTVWIGKCVPLEVKQLMARACDANDIIERMQEACYDEVGEAADNYDPATRDQINAVDAELPDLIIALFAKHGADLAPSCWSVTDVVPHELTPESEAV